MFSFFLSLFFGGFMRTFFDFHKFCFGFGVSRSKRKNGQGGFTLIEAIIVLALLGAVIATVMVRQSAANSDTKANDTVSTYANIVGQIRSAYSSAGSYTAVTNANLVNGGFIVSPLTGSGINITDPWNNPVTFAGNATLFAFSIKVQDKASCIKIVSSISANALQVTDGTTDPTTTLPFTTPTIKDSLAATQKAYDPAAAATACNKPGQFIGFLFR